MVSSPPAFIRSATSVREGGPASPSAASQVDGLAMSALDAQTWARQAERKLEFLLQERSELEQIQPSAASPEPAVQIGDVEQENQALRALASKLHRELAAAEERERGYQQEAAELVPRGTSISTDREAEYGYHG